MNRKNVTANLLISITCLFMTLNVVRGQAPVRDNFNIIFENNFEDDQLGRYLQSDYLKDWNLSSSSSMHEKEIIDIIRDSDPLRNKVMRAYYDKGTFGADQQGFLWRSYFSPYLTEVYFSYDIKFKPGFEWVMGGKIPGVTGGSVVPGIIPCSDDGFSARMMWKENGALVSYVYHQDQTIPYGSTWYWGDFKITSGKWYNLTIRVVLNTVSNGVGAKNGIMEGFVDGKLMFQKKDIKFRNLETMKIDNMYICSFFGGSNTDWAATRDEWIDTDNYVAYTYSSKVPDVSRGNTPTQAGKMLLHPYYNFSSAEAAIPAVPTALQSTAQTSSSVSLKWTDNSSNEQGFHIERSKTSGSGYQLLYTTGPNVTAYTNGGLSAGQTYYYRIRSFNAQGNSAYTSELKVTTPSSSGGSNQTAGYTEVFSSASGALNRRALPVTMSENGKITGITIYHNGGSGNALIGIYNDANGLPGQRIAVTQATAVNSMQGWQTFTLSAPVNVQAGTKIWLAWVFENNISLRYTSGEPGRAQSDDTYSAGMPEAFGKSTVSSSIYSIYANYTTTATAPPPATNSPPVIKDQQFTVTESGFANYLIGRIISTDPDEGQKLSYSILSGNSGGLFSIDAQTGDLKSTVELFGPGTLSYTLQVQVADNASEPKKATATIKVTAIGQSTTVHIDPQNTNDPLANGSVYHPYDSWNDVTWKEGYTYLQKKGTSATVDVLQIGANNVALGAYGKGALPIMNSETSTYMISGFGKSGIRISDLELQAGKAVSVIYLLGSSTDSTIVEHCMLTGNTNAIKIVDGATLISRYNSITSEHEGIFSTAKENAIHYNIFQQCNTAVNIMGNEVWAKIYNNVFVDNTKSIAASYADLTLYNNIFYMTNTGQTAISQNKGKIISDHNIFYPEQDGFVSIAGKLYGSIRNLQQELKVDLNSFNNDPEFVDMFKSDFRLKSSSPAINAGRNLDIDHDFNRIKVPMFSVTDIGAFEFNGNLDKGRKPVKEDLTLSVYPNPSNGQVNVLAEVKDESEVMSLPDIPEIKVIDITGKTIYSRFIEINGSSYQERLDLSGLSNGVYFVVLQLAGKIIKEKILINK